MRTLFTVFYAIVFLLSNIAQAQLTQTNEITNPSYQIDEQATAQAPWEAGSIIAEDNMSKDSEKPVIVYRKFLGITDKGFYVVQDFYQKSNRKQTDPLVIMQFDKVKDFVSNAVPLEGTYIQWFENEQKWVEGQFQDGKQQGLWTRWYDNGQKKSEGQFQDGKQQGLWTSWYDNGQKEAEGEYQDGKEQGLWTGWYDNGQKRAESQLQDGEPHGLATVWYKNGQKQFEGQFQDGKRQGVWTDWDQDGKKVKEMVFQAGKLVDYKSFD